MTTYAKIINEQTKEVQAGAEDPALYHERQKENRARAYRDEVDPLMSEYNRKKTFNLFEEGEEEELMKAIQDKVAEIKDRDGSKL